LLPGEITVHLQNFPGDKLIKSQAVDSCQDYFMSMIKEVRFFLLVGLNGRWQSRFFSTAGQIMEETQGAHSCHVC
jgi:hypothetical protein